VQRDLVQTEEENPGLPLRRRREQVVSTAANDRTTIAVAPA
jgi:hypothetical protein